MILLFPIELEESILSVFRMVNSWLVEDEWMVIGGFEVLRGVGGMNYGKCTNLQINPIDNDGIIRMPNSFLQLVQQLGEGLHNESRDR